MDSSSLQPSVTMVFKEDSCLRYVLQFFASVPVIIYLFHPFLSNPGYSGRSSAFETFTEHTHCCPSEPQGTALSLYPFLVSRIICLCESEFPNYRLHEWRLHLCILFFFNFTFSCTIKMELTLMILLQETTY